MKELLILIDGNSLINRAFYALPPLTTADGRPSQAVYGFCNMLVRAINEYNPTHAAVAFDLPSPTFRHKEYPLYKAGRKKMPDELACQLPMLKDLLRDMDIRILEKEGYEADDILGTMSDCGIDNIIITGDRDALQLIDDNTRVAFTKKGISQTELYDEEKFVDEYCFVPKALIDYKALCGDQSDNIPGVSGIGAKTASALICKYGSLDGVYANIDEITGKAGEKLTECRDTAYLSHMLAAINKNVPLPVPLKDCALKFPFDEKVRSTFAEYNFKSLAARPELFATGKKSADLPLLDIERRQITNLNFLNIGGDFSILIGPQSVFIAQKNPTKNSLNNSAEKSEKKHYSSAPQFPALQSQNKYVLYEIKMSGDLLGGIFLDDILRRLQPLFEDTNIIKIVFDAKSLIKILEQTKISLNNYFDIKLSQYLLDVNNRFDTIDDFCDTICPVADCAAALIHIFAAHTQKLDEWHMNDLYYKLELPLVEVLHRMESAGFKLDMQRCEALGIEFSAAADRLTSEIYAECGSQFNLNSPKQLAEVLFNQLNIPYPDKSKTHSTAFEILDPLKYDYPVIAKILDYRRVTKLNGTYIEGFKKLTGRDGVIHTDFKQTLTLTGRLSSAEPNLQNIPIREEDGRRLRELFIARDGYCLISADYSQIELRLLAHLSGDRTMLAAFNNGEDIHAQTAASVYGVPLNLVTSEMRQSAKAVNFGIIYGISDFGLAKSLRISVAKAHGLIARYFEKFDGIKQYLDGCVADAYRDGYAKTIFGRVRRINELKAANRMTKKFGERVAMNMPLQGSAADIIKAAMIRVDNRLSCTNSRLILQIHDELIVEALEPEAETIKNILISEMENVVKLNVPLSVSAGIGKRWIDCK